MNFLFTISIRNLLRQRRRSILLGSAIAFGTAILVLSNAFSHGISEVLFNEIVSYVAGHVSIGFTKKGNPMNQVFHDGERMLSIIKKQLGDDARIDEAVGSSVTRAIGNGASDNVVLVGMDPHTETDEKETRKVEKNFKLIEGSFDALTDSTIEYPVALAVEKAKSLNVKLNETISARFDNILGQVQTARLTVAAIFKPSNIFMSVPIFLYDKDLKELLGYGPHDIPSLQLRIDNPKKNAVPYADKIHAALTPPLAVIDGSFKYNNKTFRTTLLSLRTDSACRAKGDKELTIIKYQSDDSAYISKSSVIISQFFADETGLSCGDTCIVNYNGKFDDKKGRIRLIITAVAKNGAGIDGPVILVNEKEFYNAFYTVLPASNVNDAGPFRPNTTIRIYKILGGEWLLLDRIKNTTGTIKRYREIAQKGWQAITVDVKTMYETASMFLNLEIALNLITFACVMMLFFIILIGVINTLRMTIRERTREIGTVRAIGMQRNDVRNSFLIETGLLALIAAITGTIVAFIAMFALSQPTFKSDDNPLNIILVEGHLFFAPTVPATLFFIILIVLIALITAFFPAKRAAQLTAAEALRHFE